MTWKYSNGGGNGQQKPKPDTKPNEPVRKDSPYPLREPPQQRPPKQEPPKPKDN